VTYGGAFQLQPGLELSPLLAQINEIYIYIYREEKSPLDMQFHHIKLGKYTNLAVYMVDTL
jgi:hypothetical protein